MEEKKLRKILVSFVLLTISGAFIFGFLGGMFSQSHFSVFPSAGEKESSSALPRKTQLLYSNSYEKQVIQVVKNSEQSVVSIIATKDLPVVEQYFVNPFQDFFPQNSPFNFQFQIPQYRKKGTKPQEVSAGSGFVIDKRGYIATNRHVVEDPKAKYTVLMNDGKKYPARVVARDPHRDFAVLKINKTNLPVLSLGDSNNLVLGQTVIAIGNALGEFRNTVSRGVVSGLARSVNVQDDKGQEVTLHNVIQTDAAINRGNSGGPLLNLQGQVVGINTAMAVGAQNIGFAIPINLVKGALKQALTTGKIQIPYLGVRYVPVTPAVQEDRNLAVNYGALLVGEDSKPAVEPGSPAAKANLRKNDIILKFNGQKIDTHHRLVDLVQGSKVGEKATLEIWRQGKIIKKTVILSQYPEHQ